MPQLPIPPPGAISQVPISAASLKTFRPELVYKLYDGQPNQCSTCGRRFLATEEGRQQKNRHLDWHFRTNQRIADPNTNRGHHRNWYVDEMEWIRHIEFDPSTTTANAGDAQAALKAKKGPQDQSIRAPAGMTKNTCNICFEEMKSSYSEDLQDWIFTNATVHNGRIVHATCLAEMSKGQGGAGAGAGAGQVPSSLAAALASVSGGRRERSATPDSLLGKRKAEHVLVGGGARQKVE
jgi:pre-mRNA cleavage complex 2 protein Pcf11